MLREEAVKKYRELVILARRNVDLPIGTRKMNTAFALDDKWKFTDTEKKDLPIAEVRPRGRCVGQ